MGSNEGANLSSALLVYLTMEILTWIVLRLGTSACSPIAAGTSG